MRTVKKYSSFALETYLNAIILIIAFVSLSTIGQAYLKPNSVGPIYLYSGSLKLQDKTSTNSLHCFLVLPFTFMSLYG